MDFKYYDRNGTNLELKDLEHLKLWNPVMEHILTGIVSNIGVEEITVPGVLEEKNLTC